MCSMGLWEAKEPQIPFHSKTVAGKVHSKEKGLWTLNGDDDDGIPCIFHFHLVKLFHLLSIICQFLFLSS